MDFLRQQPGITKVVLFGHSGGGPTMSFYQALAENGPAYCRDPKRLVPCTEDFSGLTRADGIVFADAHPGQPVMVMRALMPVANEANPPNAPLIPELDPLSPADRLQRRQRVCISRKPSSRAIWRCRRGASTRSSTTRRRG